MKRISNFIKQLVQPQRSKAVVLKSCLYVNQGMIEKVMEDVIKTASTKPLDHVKIIYNPDSLHRFQESDIDRYASHNQSKSESEA